MPNNPKETASRIRADFALTKAAQDAIEQALAEQIEQDAKLCEAVASIYAGTERLSAKHCAESVRAQVRK